MNQTAVIKIFQDAGALLEGHFRLTSGKHSARYIQCAQVLQYPEATARLAAMLADGFAGEQIDLVIGPAMGGILVAYEVARALDVRAIFAEREQGVMSLRRGFQISPGQRVLVVEDVVTTGGSVREVVDIVRNCGGEVAGVGALVDRSGGHADFGAPFRATLQLNIETFDPYKCPLCQQGLPAVKPGSRQV